MNRRNVPTKKAAPAKKAVIATKKPIVKAPAPAEGRTISGVSSARRAEERASADRFRRQLPTRGYEIGRKPEPAPAAKPVAKKPVAKAAGVQPVVKPAAKPVAKKAVVAPQPPAPARRAIVEQPVRKPVVAKKVVAAPPKKRYVNHFIRIRSRHGSIDPLRKAILCPLKVLYRHGSTTELDLDKYDVEINSADAIRNSSSKRLMKECFTRDGVKTATYWNTYQELMAAAEIPFPIVAKHIFGSRGEGNYLLKTKEELEAWTRGKTLNSYIFEKFYNFNREYRLHVTDGGCFYTCRKMLKEETPEADRWYRNDSNSVWIIESNPQFEKPANWKAIEDECVKALKATGLDVGACDVRVQSAKTTKGKDREAVDFIVLEVNSAPSMGDITLEKYSEILPRIASKKNALRR